MGCCSSQFTDLREDNEESQLKEAIKEEEYLPRKQRDIIRSTWKEFLYGDYNKDAVHIFVSLFQERPETLELFDFVKNSTEQHLLHNKLLMIHVDNVVTNIDVMIDSLDDLPAVAILMYDLGKRHAVFWVKAEYFKPVAAGIIYALKRKLGSHFTDRAKTAWQAVLDFSERHFLDGLRAGEKQLNKGETSQSESDDQHSSFLSGSQSSQAALEADLHSAWDTMLSAQDTLEAGSQSPPDTPESGLRSPQPLSGTPFSPV
ncbi:hypothetical protein BaRGS_00018519 [Batillaria attramentaria]|uniref:Globin n=1 Tax=Batillaria attramentaria TaxID=370345 RepID=A0ABD0KSG2_9CAEN